ncbi:MAG TPA: hypothetical protein VMH50_11610, partial [Thermoleophilia bacterium]|nr:hypothetical protein [Thermoleophilia bacterium]
IYTEYNIDTYLSAHPGQVTGQTAGAGGSGRAVVGVVVAVLVLAGVAAVVLLRRRGRAVEE